MRVTLAYPWTDPDGQDHSPDDTVTVSVTVGKQLIRDGRARPSDDEYEPDQLAGPLAEAEASSEGLPPAARPTPTPTQYLGPKPPGGTA